MTRFTRRRVLTKGGLLTAVLIPGCSYTDLSDSPETGGKQVRSETPETATPRPKSETETLTPRAQSQAEVEELLPVYGTPSTSKERAEEIKNAIWDALYGYDWLVSAGLTLDDNDEWVIVVGSKNVGEASQLLPDQWEGVPISVEKRDGSITLV
jgi:hypothetical protein